MVNLSAPTPNQKLAVLIDAENISSEVVQGLFDEIAKYGTANIRKIYGDWTNPAISPWRGILHLFALQPVQQFSYTTGKSSSDSALIIDAMDILLEGKMDGFCIVSSDSDFTRLASRIRESGLIVFGFGKQTTPDAFRQACDRFILIENLRHLELPILETTPSIPKKKEKKIDVVPQEIKKIPPIEEPKEIIVNKLSEEQLIQLVKGSVEDAMDENGWALLSDVGGIIRRKAPDFDHRTYGHEKLSSLIDALKIFEVQSRKTDNPSVKILLIRLKQDK
ncbi:MAG: NYN domain-containing protein [Candidatus Bathyarchaeota archaeon]|nr:NYN domain-containing protein [Candidatus Bathyarchaeota archaeon]